ncbi:MAG: anti-sigma factor RsbA family regulatory protein [Nocardioides sp.]
MTMRSDSGHSGYSHDLLVHHSDEELVHGTRAFVEQGLASGGQVLVHGSRDRVGLLRQELGAHPRLEYGFDEELYQAPTDTLFAYQRKLAEAGPGVDFWVTGTVPLGRDAAERAAWARYESAVNEALSAYSFRALCTYDARTLPGSVIDAARATHPTVSTDLTSRTSPEYVDPAAFLADPLAQVPGPPGSPPSLAITIHRLDQLARARHQVRTTARASSAVPQRSIDELLVAVNEVVANGLVHGAPPVQLSLWVDVTTLTCRVVDSGMSALDPVTGYRHPEDWGPMGLWAARQLVDELFISSPAEGGCSVLLTKT